MGEKRRAGKRYESKQSNCGKAEGAVDVVVAVVVVVKGEEAAVVKGEEVVARERDGGCPRKENRVTHECRLISKSGVRMSLHIWW